MLAGSIQAHIRRTLDRFQSDHIEDLQAWSKDLHIDLQLCATNVMSMSQNPLRLLRNPADFVCLYQELGHLLTLAKDDIPRFYVRMSMWYSFSGFPGGVYGCVCFLLFYGLVLAKIVKLFFDARLFM